MTAGPWRPVRLERYSSRIEDVSIEYKLDENMKHCSGIISALVDGHAGDEIRLALRSPEGDFIFESQCAVNEDCLIQTPFEIQTLSLWYPHGYGDQPRYYLDAEISTRGKAVHLMTRRIGFRRAELIQEPDIYGKSFYFRINGVDVFAGGNCWIPADCFTPRLSEEKYRQWVALMVEGNQIMTRYVFC